MQILPSRSHFRTLLSEEVRRTSTGTFYFLLLLFAVLLEEFGEIVEFFGGDLFEESGEFLLPEFAVFLDAPLELAAVQHDEANVGDCVLFLRRV